MKTPPPTTSTGKRPAPRRKPRAKARFNPVTDTYRAQLEQLDRRRRELGWTHDRLCAEAGIGRGHWAHYLGPDLAAGRVMVWATLDKAFRALYPEGFHIVPAEPSILDALSIESEAVPAQGCHVVQTTSEAC